MSGPVDKVHVNCPMCGRTVPPEQQIPCGDSQFQPFCKFRGATDGADHLHGFCRHHAGSDRPAQGEFIILVDPYGSRVSVA